MFIFFINYIGPLYNKFQQKRGLKLKLSLGCKAYTLCISFRQRTLREVASENYLPWLHHEYHIHIIYRLAQIRIDFWDSTVSRKQADDILRLTISVLIMQYPCKHQQNFGRVRVCLSAAEALFKTWQLQQRRALIGCHAASTFLINYQTIILRDIIILLTLRDNVFCSDQ